MIEFDREDLILRYPALKDEIEDLVSWWKNDIKRFVVPAESHHTEVDGEYLTHADVYDRKCWLRSEAFDKSEQEMREHNKQLLNLLKNEFGWKEEHEEYYPNPERTL